MLRLAVWRALPQVPGGESGNEPLVGQWLAWAVIALALLVAVIAQLVASWGLGVLGRLGQLACRSSLVVGPQKAFPLVILH